MTETLNWKTLRRRIQGMPGFGGQKPVEIVQKLPIQYFRFLCILAIPTLAIALLFDENCGCLSNFWLL
jgi:hypothetical protein